MQLKQQQTSNIPTNTGQHEKKLPYLRPYSPPYSHSPMSGIIIVWKNKRPLTPPKTTPHKNSYWIQNKRRGAGPDEIKLWPPQQCQPKRSSFMPSIIWTTRQSDDPSGSGLIRLRWINMNELQSRYKYKASSHYQSSASTWHGLLYGGLRPGNY